MRVALIALCALLLSTVAWAAFQVPTLREPVQDEAGILSSREKQELGSLIRQAQESGLVQLQILIVPTLDGEPIESASIKVTDAWKLGTAKDDQGVLFLIAVNDRKMRIEVGQGLEGSIPDVIAKRILADRVAPRFRAGQMAAGVREGTYEILRVAGAPPGSATEEVGVAEKGPAIADWAHMIFMLIFIILMMSGKGGRRRGLLGGMLLGGSAAGWGGGSRGGGGGGWSGGGGGFSGGGASSGW